MISRGHGSATRDGGRGRLSAMGTPPEVGGKEVLNNVMADLLFAAERQRGSMWLACSRSMGSHWNLFQPDARMVTSAGSKNAEEASWRSVKMIREAVRCGLSQTLGE